MLIHWKYILVSASLVSVQQKHCFLIYLRACRFSREENSYLCLHYVFLQILEMAKLYFSLELKNLSTLKPQIQHTKL